MIERPRSSRALRVVVVGGGVTGLSTAYFLTRARPDLQVRVLEARDFSGGNIQTERYEGCVLDTGPDSFLITKPAALLLCRALGLEGRLVATRPEARRVYFVHRGKLVEMPAGMALAVPTRVLPMVTTPLLSVRGKLRALAEPLISRTDGADESIEEFFSRRFGRQAASRLASPLLGGVYAGDTAQLSIRATFPQLIEMERKHGSLVRGYFAAERREGSLLGWLLRSREKVSESPFRSLEGGMATLISALEGALSPGTLRTGAEVLRIARPEGGPPYRVATSLGEHDADAVVLAVPAHVAARLVPAADVAQELAAVPHVSTATVFLAFEKSGVTHRLDGLGFVAPAGESDVLAGTWVSSKWSGRAPEQTVLMRAFVGGSQSSEFAESASDSRLTELVLSELRRLLGRLERPLWSRVFRYVRGSPQPIVGHLARMRRVEQALGGLPGLHVAGAGYDGVGIPDCVRQAERVAARILETS